MNQQLIKDALHPNLIDKIWFAINEMEEKGTQRQDMQLYVHPITNSVLCMALNEQLTNKAARVGFAHGVPIVDGYELECLVLTAKTTTNYKRISIF